MTECWRCGGATERVCSLCVTAMYCGAVCQQADRVEHAAACSYGRAYVDQLFGLHQLVRNEYRMQTSTTDPRAVKDMDLDLDLSMRVLAELGVPWGDDEVYYRAHARQLMTQISSANFDEKKEAVHYSTAYVWALMLAASMRVKCAYEAWKALVIVAEFYDKTQGVMGQLNRDGSSSAVSEAFRRGAARDYVRTNPGWKPAMRTADTMSKGGAMRGVGVGAEPAGSDAPATSDSTMALIEEMIPDFVLVEILKHLQTYSDVASAFRVNKRWHGLLAKKDTMALVWAHGEFNRHPVVISANAVVPETSSVYDVARLVLDGTGCMTRRGQNTVQLARFNRLVELEIRGEFCHGGMFDGGGIAAGEMLRSVKIASPELFGKFLATAGRMTNLVEMWMPTLRRNHLNFIMRSNYKSLARIRVTSASSADPAALAMLMAEFAPQLTALSLKSSFNLMTLQPSRLGECAGMRELRLDMPVDLGWITNTVARLGQLEALQFVSRGLATGPADQQPTQIIEWPTALRSVRAAFAEERLFDNFAAAVMPRLTGLEELSLAFRLDGTDIDKQRRCAERIAECVGRNAKLRELKVKIFEQSVAFSMDPDAAAVILAACRGRVTALKFDIPIRHDPQRPRLITDGLSAIGPQLRCLGMNVGYGGGTEARANVIGTIYGVLPQLEELAINTFGPFHLATARAIKRLGANLRVVEIDCCSYRAAQHLQAGLDSYSFAIWEQGFDARALHMNIRRDRWVVSKQPGLPGIFNEAAARNHRDLPPYPVPWSDIAIPSQIDETSVTVPFF